MINWSILGTLLLGGSVCTVTGYVLWRITKSEKIHKSYIDKCNSLVKALDEERLKVYSMYLDAKSERRAYQMRREKLEQYLKDGLGRVNLSASDLSAETIGLNSAEIEMLYQLLSKMRSKEPQL